MKKVLVAYFSATGTTKRAAENLAQAAEAELYEICPAIPYTRADLNWMDKKSRSSVEMNNPSSRPALKDTNANFADYDTIFLCFPIWWYVAPTIINTFLEVYDFSGKKLVLCATSGGSGFGKTVESLRPSVPQPVSIVEGKMLNGKIPASELKAWADSVK